MLANSLACCVKERLCCIIQAANDWNKLLSSVGLAAADSTFILGWDELEFYRVMEWVRGRLEVTGSLRGLRIFWGGIH